MIERYFDNAATTPVDPRVVEEMLPYFSEAFGNANSIHEPGQRARAAVELARERVAELLGEEDSGWITFTSGATEANNWVLALGTPLVVSPFEHSSVWVTNANFKGEVLENQGYMLQGPRAKASCAAVMHVNNETGAIIDLPPELKVDDSDGGMAFSLLRDLTQSVGKVDLPRMERSYFASLSAHKFYGPKGVGALYSKMCVPATWMHGGEQEDGRRAGTLNVPGIVGMGVAAAIASQEADKNKRFAENLRALVLAELTKISDHKLNSPQNSSPYIVSLSFLGVEGETLAVELDRAGYSISSGAACSSRSTEPSHVLTALGLPIEWLRGTIRISFGKYNTEASAANLANELRKAVEKLRTMK
ncbi:MAG: cysteine desulfurase [Fimbriimonadaceae bacterium]|nr:cysteine desulfurase [Fimbriimonadaceae bacterium]